MAYTPTSWANGVAPYLNATNLNHIEQGIADAHALGAGSFPMLVVAASDSPAAWKAAASSTYTCDGTADDAQINAAIDAAAVSTGTTSENSRSSMGRECLVLLAPGTYYCTAPIDVHSRVTLRGATRGGVVIQAAAGHSAIGSATSGIVTISDPAGDPYDHMAVENLSIHGRGYDLNGVYSSYAQSDVSKDDGNLGGTPDHHNNLRDLVIVGCGRSGVYISFTQASTAWLLDRVKVFGCGDTLATSAGIYFNGVDSFLSNCDVGSQGSSGTTNVGFQVAGSDTSVSNCDAWLTKGTGFLVTGANLKFGMCEAHHSNADGFKITNNRNSFVACQSYNNGAAGWRLSGANSVSIIGCTSYYYTDSYAMVQAYGVYIEATNPSGHRVDLTTYGVSLTPIAGDSTDAALRARKPNHYSVHHTGTNPDGSSGTVQEIEWRFGCLTGWGDGTPEGAVSAPIGSQYTDYTGGNIYRKATGTGNTGWTAM